MPIVKTIAAGTGIQIQDLERGNMNYLGMKQEFQQIISDFTARTAYVEPEILSAEWPVIKGFLEEEPGLKPYEKILSDMFRLKEQFFARLNLQNLN